MPTPLPMASPACTCTGCGFAWHSATLVHGLRLIGSCPKCGGTLAFAEDAAPVAESAAELEAMRGVAPHMAMGIPEIP